MPPNQDGSRNLYYEDPQSGAILVNEDGSRTVQYACRTRQGKSWVIQYIMNGDRCVKIAHYYKP